MIYAHIPWCRVHCPYCAFLVRVQRDPPWARFLDSLLLDLERQLPALPGPSATLYLGGGTPSLLPPRALARLLASAPLAPDAEITLEVNPGTVDREGLRERLRLGVNRLSLGVQTFDEGLARRLGRGHDLRAALGLLDDVAALGPRSWSLDLMFALPGQTLAQVEADLDALLGYRPPHVSLYGLTIEEGTAFHRARVLGRLREADEELWAAMLARVVRRLTGAGYERYEVSNFALPGHRSRHNEATWRGAHYLGLGPGAHGYLPPVPGAPFGRRTVQPDDVEAWMADPRPQVEVLDGPTWAADLLLSTLRHQEGTPLARLAEAGFTLEEAALARLAGLIVRERGHLRLTEPGRDLADGITARLVAALRPATNA